MSDVIFIKFVSLQSGGHHADVYVGVEAVRRSIDELIVDVGDVKKDKVPFAHEILAETKSKSAMSPGCFRELSDSTWYEVFRISQKGLHDVKRFIESRKASGASGVSRGRHRTTRPRR